MKKGLPLLACFLVSFTLQAHALDVPELRGYVNDYASMISSPTRAKLEEGLKAFDQSDSTQVFILTLPSLEGEALEDYSIRVVEDWKIGQARKDNGILLLVSKNDRKIRIEVGRGLEGRLTDLMAGRIVDLVITPRFKRGDYDGGVAAGIDALIDATRGEFQGEQKDSREASQPFGSSWLFLGIIILLFIIFSFARRRSKLGNASTGGFLVLPSKRGGRGGFGDGGGIFGGGGTFGGGGGGTFGGGGASGSW
jgi:uncharacterized protein